MLQVIVTSYCRPLYLEPCLKSLRQDEVELYVVDGGSDRQTIDLIKAYASRYILLSGNPGADVLKNEGIKAFATNPEFMITSDDIQYPAGYSQKLMAQYEKLNQGRRPPHWTFCACSLPHYVSHPGEIHNGVNVLPTGTSQVLGAIIDTEVCRSVGHFPVYGKSGQGDWAFSKRLRDRGIQMCYFREPVVVHLGLNKLADYPEYSAEFRKDEDYWLPLAQRDALR